MSGLESGCVCSEVTPGVTNPGACQGMRQWHDSFVSSPLIGLSRAFPERRCKLPEVVELGDKEWRSVQEKGLLLTGPACSWVHVNCCM